MSNSTALAANGQYLTNQANAALAQPGNGPAVADFGQQAGGASAYSNQVSGIGNQFLNQTAPNPYSNQFGQAAQGDQAQFAADQAQQQASLAQLWAQANGQGPNPAAAQMAAGQQQAAVQNISQAKSALPGAAGALAARAAQTANATGSINNANATAQVNAQQRAAALQQYNQAAQQYAQGAQQNQGTQQQFGMAYGQMQGQQNAENAQNQANWQQMAQQAQYAQLQSDTNQITGQMNVGTQEAQAANAANAAFNSQLTGAGISGVAALALLSDEDLKEDIHDEGSLADQFMGHLHPYTFKYKNPQDEPSLSGSGGRYLGVMAQDVERAPGGDQIVMDTPRGKMLQGAPSIGAALAGVGRLHERVSQLEKENMLLKGAR